MLDKRLFKIAIFLLASVAFLNFVDSKLYLSWYYWWFDKSLHFTAGIIVGISSFIFSSYFPKFFNKNKKIIVFSIIAIFIIGILWELFELYFDITSLSDGYVYYKDTFIDLVMDVLGGFLGTIYSLRSIKK